MTDRLAQQMRFCLEIDQEKNIDRHTYTTEYRRENDAEHAWHMAVMAMVLHEYANEDVDLLRVIELLLVHDLVEIYAGDTFAYDEEGKKTQKERETQAADRLYAMLPDDQEQYFRGLWDEFENEQTPEARFAHTLDNFQPVMLNDATGGKLWQEAGAHLDQILERNHNTAAGSKTLWEYSYHHFIEPHVGKEIKK
ncbi:HD domain-containing protein [Catenisphaera adipataccumulans]|uniref:Putative hydrolase of HD superfamily n=1 Tax=Catenisphaera adipataccumulans TaxID=700500 RepID=A0A7W8CXV3_9FIRM|nr:HD domain-containing protein [Catenisphaera adipataccumulans]MBB5182448.1 putative hydrolase of HD superfamily [Catenisphaera adipataccumulans]